MDLRPELEPEEPSKEKAMELLALIESIVTSGGNDMLLLQRFTQLTGYRRDMEDFKALRPGSGKHALFQEVKYGQPARLADISRDELVEIASRALLNIDKPAILNWYALALDRNVVMPSASDLLFFPPGDLPVETVDYEPDPSEIIDRILAYKPSEYKPPSI